MDTPSAAKSSCAATVAATVGSSRSSEASGEPSLRETAGAHKRRGFLDRAFTKVAGTPKSAASKSEPLSSQELERSRTAPAMNSQDETQTFAAAHEDHSKSFGFGGRRYTEVQKGNNPVFADPAAMKDKLRQAVIKEPYDVKSLYHKHGIAQRIARNRWFEQAGLMVIFLNCIWIPIDIDVIKHGTLKELDPLYLTLEHSFCAFFFLEWFVCFLAFESKMQGLRDYWFCLDSILVPLMVCETWIMRPLMYITSEGETEGGLANASVLKLLRVIRLCRVFRMARLLKRIPEVMILIKGLAVAARSVFCTICLLAIIIYFFAIFFTELTDTTDLGDKRFRTVMYGMKTLLLYATLPDLADIVEEAGDEHFFFALLMMVYILLATLTVMNMLIGVLVEVVSVVSAVEIEELSCVDVKLKLQSIYGVVDLDQSSTISRREFEGLLMLPEAARTIQAVGVDVVGLVDFADFIFPDDAELSFGDFMELILQFRGSNTATVRDIVELRKFMMTGLEKKLTP